MRLVFYELGRVISFISDDDAAATGQTSLSLFVTNRAQSAVGFPVAFAAVVAVGVDASADVL